MRIRPTVLAAITIAGLLVPVLPVASATAGSYAGDIPPPAAASSAPTADQAARAVDGLELYRPAQDPRGRTWGMWAARYFEWFQEIRVPRNPAVDPDSPRNCERQYHVTFMGPTGTGDGCEVPADRAVLFSFLGWSCSTAEGNGRAWHKLRRCVRQSFEKELTDIKVRLRLDGRVVADPWRWTFGSARRVARLPKDNVWGVESGRTRFLGKGLMFMLRPMEPGEHVIRVRLREDGEDVVLRYPFSVG